VTTAVVIVAGGSGMRLGHKLPKAFIPLATQTMLEHCVSQLDDWAEPCRLVVVVPDGFVLPAESLLVNSTHPLNVVVGGATRTDSVRAGLSTLGQDITHVLVHDAARPLTPLDVFDRVLESLRAGNIGVIPTVPIVDTLVSFDPVTKVTGPGGDRALMGAVQTPQGFGAAELISAYESASGDFTDDAAVMREAGHDVVSVEGDARGFKITYPEDLERARLLVSGGTQTRVGTVLDVHRYDPDGVLSLAGLLWPGEAGLSGHSDGDVVLHAIVDALLQAAGRGDLGSHFGSDRPEYADAQSAVFLNRALELVRDAGYRVHSVGVQIIANAPKIGPRREEAERHLTGLVGAPVALSATTTDGLGFTGRGEGMAALATAVLVTA